MSSRAIKFKSRAPRYSLSPKDNRYMRFAYEHDHGHSFTTRFIDISQTGLSFVIDREHAPHLSDLIKMEIPLGENNSVAWWGRVVRVEEYAPHKWYMKNDDFANGNQVLTAVTFHELPEGHAKIIREILNKKFDELYAEKRRAQRQHLIYFITTQFWRILIYGFCIVATIWFLYYFSRPSYNYDADKGAPWGERYPWLMIKSDKNDK